MTESTKGIFLSDLTDSILSSHMFGSGAKWLKSFLFFIEVVDLLDLEHREKWTLLLQVIVDQAKTSKEHSEDVNWAYHCFDAIEKAEYSLFGLTSSPYYNTTNGVWSRWYSPEKTVVSDAIVNGLACISPHAYADRRRQWNNPAASQRYISQDKDDNRGVPQ